MGYSKDISLIKSAIGTLEETKYSIWDFETIENDIAKNIISCTDILKETLKMAIKFEEGGE